MSEVLIDTDILSFYFSSDLLIAGIAIQNDLILITNNEKHYTPIRNLRVENWLK